MSDIVLRTVAYGTGGVIIGSLYTLYNQLVGEDYTDILSVPYSYIHLNNELLNLFITLDDDFMNLDKVAYFRAVKAIDEIIHIRIAINNDQHAATIEHRVDAFVQFRMAKLSIQRFLTVAEERDDAKNVIKIQRLLKQVMTCLENEMHFILVMTRDLH